MAEFEEVFFSFTMGGEALSLAAAKAALCKLRRERVIEALWSRGMAVIAGVQERIARHGCSKFLEAKGHPSWSFLVFQDANEVSSYEIYTLWMQEILARGILSTGTHNVSFAHTEADIDHLFSVYDEVFPILSEAVEDGEMTHYLRCEPLKPLFRVRK